MAVSLSTAFAQVSESVRQRFEAGLYEEALQLAIERREQNTATAGDIYFAAQILLKLGQRDQAKPEAGPLMSVFCRPFTTATIRYVDDAAIEDARTWLASGAQ